MTDHNVPSNLKSLNSQDSLAQDNVMAIAASAALCSLALKTPSGIFHWQSVDTNQHSEQILPAVADLLARAGIAKPDVIAVDIGPGAFTSVRVACGVAQGLALGWECGVMAVQSLTALAQQCSTLAPNAKTVACVLDARMNECYVAHYALTPVGVVQTRTPSLLAYEQVMNLQVDAVIGNAAAVLHQWQGLAAKVFDALPSAEGVLAQVLMQGRSALVFPEHLQPLYVRNQVALTTVQRAAGMVM
jgi:tRNA threonylcarbamoyladenosine biosynthesis protein TsaB